MSLDNRSIRLLSYILEFGIRRLGSAARRLDVSRSTVMSRFRAMLKNGLIEVYSDVDYSLLRLLPFEVEAVSPAKPGIVEKCLRGYWIFKSEYMDFDGVWGYLYRAVLPADRYRKIVETLEERVGKGLHKLYRVAGWHHPKHGVEWVSETGFEYRWQELVDNIRSSSRILPRRLVASSPPSRPLVYDRIDVLILRELEKSPLSKFAQIAKRHGLKPHVVRYHYRVHLEANDVIKPFRARVGIYLGKKNLLLNLRLNFRSEGKMAQFVNSLNGKHVAGMTCRVVGTNTLRLDLPIPANELQGLMDLLKELKKRGYIELFKVRLLRNIKFKLPPYSKLKVKAGSWRL